MFLKSIVLNGFKSFALRREILIQEGITGVVGPNGSGKSNIADAMRWVLGEQSSRNLRGASMQEVIFKGTQTRPAKSSCEVSLLFDNEDHRFDVAYAEVCVTRRMFRSGENEYSINGANCRLKDVVALFRGTGLGRDGYSIIGQGRINRILDSRASERRAVFDEAAGIMKYRVRKDEAERNLLKTQDNITRVDDIIGELTAQIEPLEKQTQDAKEYVSLSEELRSLDVNLILRSLEQAKEKEAQIQGRLRERREALASASGEKQSVADTRNETRETLRKLREELESLQSDSLDAEARKGQAVANERLADQKRGSLEQSLREVDVRRESSEKKLNEQRAYAEGLAPELESLTRRERAAAEELRDFVSQYSPAASGTEKAAAKRRVEELEQSAARLAESSFQAKLQAELARSEAERLGRERAETEQRLSGLADEVEGWRREGREAIDALRQAESELLYLQNRAQNAAQTVQRAQKALAETERQISSGEAKAALIEEMQSGYEGYYESVRGLMKSVAGRGISREIIGAVGECIEVESRFETAIEIALGNAVQNVIVTDDAAAKALIDILRSERLGRVTFLPVRTLSIRTLNASERRTLSEPGILGVASEMVRCGEEARPAVEYLLARTVIAEDMDAALSLKRQKKNTFRIVTLQGDVVVSGGAITGGSSRRPQVSLLARKRMAEELKRRLDELRERAGQLSSGAQNAVRSRTELEGKMAEAAEKLRGQKERVGILRDKTERGEDEKNTLKHQLESIEYNIQQTSASLAALEEEQAEADAGSEKLTSELAAARSDLEALEKEESQRELEDASRAAQAARMETGLEQIRAQITLKTSERDHALQAMRETQDELENLSRRQQSLAGELETAKTDRERFQEQTTQAERRIAETSEKTESKQREVRREEENLEFLEQRLAGAQEQENEFNRQLYSLEADLEKNATGQSALTERLWTEYELTLANAQDLRTETFAAREAPGRLKAIRARLRELGPINPNAVEEYNRVRERLSSLETQRDDLVKAAADLEVVISEIMKAMKTTFEDRFQAINEAYSRTFRELFGGGSACVELEEGAPMMEAGIEIKAEPPGKKLQNISLLSGGEKALTAIALCFAMLEVNPSPICLLDEIDAPLDDRNVTRLAEYLTRLKDKLQFIVITHKKTTMDACDTLYGIAMHEKGVSDIVSVDMSGKDL